MFHRPIHAMMVFITLFSGTQITMAQTAPQPLRATLLADVNSISGGQSFTVGVLMTLQPGWHTYWLNPGEAGSAPQITWQMPNGFEVDQLQWPLPIKFSKEGEPAGYGYKDQVLLTAKVYVASHVKISEQVKLSAKVQWLVCDENKCLPGEAVVSVNIAVGREKIAAEEATLKRFAEAAASLPVECQMGTNVMAFPAPLQYSPLIGSDLLRAVLTWRFAIPGVVKKPAHYKIICHWKEQREPAAVEFFPGAGAGYEIQNVTVLKNENANSPNSVIEFDVEKFAGIETKVTSLRSLVVYRDVAGLRRGVWINVPLEP